MGPGGLRDILADAEATLGAAPDERVLVGLGAPDDAAVVALERGGDPCAVLTADVITPACDDPFLFGQLAAANALSDVFAMGGRPVAVLNLCFFPEDAVCPAPVKRRILEGVAERVRAAGAVVVGGHSVRDAELKMGLCVMGTVARAHVLLKGGLRVGQQLILTKPLGSGVLINGYRKDLLGAQELEAALRIQVDLNDRAARVALEHGATGATDITGFGLCGHALEMARGAGVTLVFRTGALPLHAAAVRMVDAGVSSRGQKDNQADAGPSVDVEEGVQPVRVALSHDPQTSGGLLFGVDPARVASCLQALHAAGVSHSAHVGSVEAGPARVRLTA